MGVAIDYMNDPSSINSTQDIFITQNTFTQCGMTNMLQVIVSFKYFIFKVAVMIYKTAIYIFKLII